MVNSNKVHKTIAPNYLYLVSVHYSSISILGSFYCALHFPECVDMCCSEEGETWISKNIQKFLVNSQTEAQQSDHPLLK